MGHVSVCCLTVVFDISFVVLQLCLMGPVSVCCLKVVFDGTCPVSVCCHIVQFHWSCLCSLSYSCVLCVLSLLSFSCV